jgi:hypothetical protein
MITAEKLHPGKIGTLIIICSHPADRKLVSAGLDVGKGEFIEAFTDPFKYVPSRQFAGDLKLADADTVSHYSHVFAAPLFLYRVFLFRS